MLVPSSESLSVQQELVSYISHSRVFTVFILATAGVGIVKIVRPILSLLLLLAELYLLPGRSLKVYGSAKDPQRRAWAVVTGATDGIGKEFALQLASQGFNVLLASRSAERLGAVAGEIESKYPGTLTKTHAIDFSSRNAASYASLVQLLEPLNVGVLVNNVGKSHDMPVAFHEVDLREMDDIVEINVAATLRVTRAVLPGMVERRRGLVLTVGSFAGEFPTPLLATYSGTKSFLIGWSQALGEELARTGVDVSLLNTYFVTSKLSKIRRSSLTVPTPRQYVAKVLRMLGRQGGAVGRPYTSTPWPGHALADWFIHHVVPSDVLLRYTMTQQLNIRSRALAKAQRAAAKSK